MTVQLKVAVQGNCVGDQVAMYRDGEPVKVIKAGSVESIRVPAGQLEDSLTVRFRAEHGAGGPDTEIADRVRLAFLTAQEAAVVQAMRDNPQESLGLTEAARQEPGPQGV